MPMSMLRLDLYVFLHPFVNATYKRVTLLF